MFAWMGRFDCFVTLVFVCIFAAGLNIHPLLARHDGGLLSRYPGVQVNYEDVVIECEYVSQKFYCPRW